MPNTGTTGSATLDIPWTTTTINGAAGLAPNWISAGNNDNTIGNGVAFIRTRRSAGFVISNLVLQIGSTTTFGTGAALNWQFNLPTSVYAGLPAGVSLAWGIGGIVGSPQYVTAATVFGVHGSTSYNGGTLVTSLQGSNVEAQIGAVLGAPIMLNNAAVTNTAPWTWAANDLLVISWAAEAYGI